MKVLIVDDSKTVQRINSNVCESIDGIEEVKVADNGQEGLDIFKEFKPDLVLLDVNMPIMNGFEFLEAIKPIKGSCKVFMCTTEGGKQEVVRALKLGANNYIVKPIKREVLTEKIKEIF